MTRLATASAALLALALALPLAARADDASHRAKAEQMLTLMHVDKGVQENADSITKKVDSAADGAAGPNATDTQKAKIADFKKQAAPMVDADLGWAAMKSALVDLYMKTFTEEQLDAIIAFYKTPAGATLLEKQGDLAMQFRQISNSHTTELNDQLQKSFKDLQQSLRPVPTLGPPSSPAPAAPAPGK